MKSRQLVIMMAIAALVITLVVYLFTGSIKWAVGVGGVCFAIDLTFAPWIKKKLEEINRGR